MSKRAKRQQSRSRGRKRVIRKQQSTAGLWLLLVVVLLVTVVWASVHIPIDLLHQIEVGGIVLVLVVVLMIVVWFARRYRLTPEERAQQEAQLVEQQLADETALAVGSREIELDHLRYLTNTEFEQLTAALVEAMGVASEVQVVGGAGDGGIDLLGKNRFRQPFVAQCKRYFGHPVVPKETREFGGAMNGQGAHDGWFVTTSTFTTQAKRDVIKWTSPGLMVLVDGELLLSFICKHWDALPADWQWRLTKCMSKSEAKFR